MKVTAENNREVRVVNVSPMKPQIIRVLDSKGMCIAFVVVGYNSTTVQIGLCQENNFELELEKELV